MKLTHLPNNNNIILSCIDSNSNVQAIIFNNGLNIISSYNQFSSCQSIYGHNIVYSIKYLGYYIISDVVCGKYKRSFEPLEGELEEITEEQSTTQRIEDISSQNFECDNEEKSTEREKNEKEKEKEKSNEEKENLEEKIKEKEKEEITDINKQESEFESDQRIIENNITLEFQDEFLINLRTDLMKGFNNTKLDKGEDIIFSLGEITYTLTTTNNQKNKKIIIQPQLI